MQTLLREHADEVKEEVRKEGASVRRHLDAGLDFKAKYEAEREAGRELRDKLIACAEERDALRKREEERQREAHAAAMERQHTRDVPAKRGREDEHSFFRWVEEQPFVSASGIAVRQTRSEPRSGDMVLRVPLPGRPFGPAGGAGEEKEALPASEKTCLLGVVDKKAGQRTGPDLHKLVRDAIHLDADFGILVYNDLPPSFCGWVDFASSPERIDMEKLGTFLTKDGVGKEKEKEGGQWRLPNLACFVACEPRHFQRAVFLLCARCDPCRSARTGEKEGGDASVSENLLLLAGLQEEMQNMFDFLYGGLKQDRLRVRVEALRSRLVGAKRRLLQEGPYFAERKRIYDQVKRMHERDVFSEAAASAQGAHTQDGKPLDRC